MTINIALDAMGGDTLALPNVYGAYLALQKEPDIKVILCGPRDSIEAAAEQIQTEESGKIESRFDIAKYKRFIADGRLEIEDCDEVVGMDESPSVVVRSKKNSSMAKCFHLVRDGKASAAVSAGNSGAMMAYGIAILKRLPAVKRPAILCHFPSANGVTALLDAGANVDCKPEHLEQFASMGRIYMNAVFDREKPSVAILNIGEEENKGNELVQEAAQLIKKRMPDNFVGFVEGRDIFMGKVDVIVCDGFVGNVALKTAEGVAKAIKSILKEEFSKNAIWGLGAWLAKGGFSAMQTKLDYREYGAAPLVGLQGLGLVAHGSSDSKAMMNAIRIGALYVRQSLMEKLQQRFSNDEENSLETNAS